MSSGAHAPESEMRLREYYERYHEFKCIYKEERQLQPQKVAKNSAKK